VGRPAVIWVGRVRSSGRHLTPYWTLKKYHERTGQLGAVADYEEFMDELDKVWRHCFRVLVPGGRIVCVVGDVCLARRRNQGRHLVMPLHADIAVRTRRIGLDYLTPILWHKIANASYEVENGSSFLGKSPCPLRLAADCGR
jgi:site-specific DNA-methyltransferase (adenine-specific)